MEPMSLFFSAYISSILKMDLLSYSEVTNMYMEAVEIEYKGLYIPFQHQVWKVRDSSVCQRYISNTLKYSKCTVTAKELFTNLCRDLSRTKKDVSNRHQRMYCNAAHSYTPTYASISAAKQDSTITVARKACNTATISAMSSSDVRLINERKTACENYEKVKQGL